jgi:hypothetical protein
MNISFAMETPCQRPPGDLSASTEINPQAALAQPPE